MHECSTLPAAFLALSKSCICYFAIFHDAHRSPPHSARSRLITFAARWITRRPSLGHRDLSAAQCIRMMGVYINFLLSPSVGECNKIFLIRKIVFCISSTDKCAVFVRCSSCELMRVVRYKIARYRNGAKNANSFANVSTAAAAISKKNFGMLNAHFYAYKTNRLHFNVFHTHAGEQRTIIALFDVISRTLHLPGVALTA